MKTFSYFVFSYEVLTIIFFNNTPSRILLKEVNIILPKTLLSEPLNMLLFGAGLMAFSTSLRKI